MPDDWEVQEVTEETLESINIPFLHQDLVGRRVKVARICGKGVGFKGSQRGFHNSTLTIGRIVVLAESGQLVRVELSAASQVDRIPGQMTLLEAEERLRATSEKYESLSVSPPAVTLQDILNTAYRASFAEFEKSKRIEAMFLVHSQAKISESQPVWIVSGVGFPPFRSKGASVGIEARSRVRHRLSPSGELLRMDNQP